MGDTHVIKLVFFLVNLFWCTYILCLSQESRRWRGNYLSPHNTNPAVTMQSGRAYVCIFILIREKLRACDVHFSGNLSTFSPSNQYYHYYMILSWPNSKNKPLLYLEAFSPLFLFSQHPHEAQMDCPTTTRRVPVVRVLGRRKGLVSRTLMSWWPLFFPLMKI